MKNQSRPSTRSASNFPDWIILLFLFGMTMLWAASASGQSVQSMVKNQPFPFAQGVAMDTVLYKSVKAKLQAAEALKASSTQTIAALRIENEAISKVADDWKHLSTYDARKSDSLERVLITHIKLWEKARDEADQAQRMTDEVLAKLPRSIRKTLNGATPDQIATATVDYIQTLRIRKWKWAGAGVGGSLFTLLLLSLR